MTETQRFKIDVSGRTMFWFGLYRRASRWGRTVWKEVMCFDTRDGAKSFYEKIKDLPEYLP